jgi:plastocyanin
MGAEQTRRHRDERQRPRGGAAGVLWLAGLALVLPVAAAAQTGGDPNPPADCAGVAATVRILGSAVSFSPATVTVQAGQPVCWTWSTTMAHNVFADNGSFSSGVPDSSGTFQVTFTTPGTYGYRCQLHGTLTLGMRGTVVVTAGDDPEPEPERGTLRFAAGNANFSEGAGSAKLTVQRVGGDDGTVSVQYATTAGSATAPQDFTATSGMLSWSDGDDAGKTITVPLVDDTAVEGSESFVVTLANVAGGAALGSPASATVTIGDNDGAAPTPPAAPAELKAAGVSASEVVLTWSDGSNNEASFRVERRDGGTFVEIGSVGPNVRTFTDSGLGPGTLQFYRVRAQNAGGSSAYTLVAAGATDGDSTPCAPSSTTLCLQGGRFEARVTWRTAGDSGDAQAVPLPSAPDSGLFWFFSPQNVELLLKVLDACTLNQRHWVFFAATSNVELLITIRDSASGRTWAYFNPLDRPAPPVQDTAAFATCP